MLRELRVLDARETTAIDTWLIDFLACVGSKTERILTGRSHATAAAFANSIGALYATRAEQAAFEPQWAAYRAERDETLVEVCNALLWRTAWAKHPALRALVTQGMRADHADAWRTTKNGQAFYDKLIELGSQRGVAAQENLVQEWARIYNAAHSNDGHGQRLLAGLDSHEALIDKLQKVQTNYEAVDEQRAQAVTVFAKAMLKILAQEVPVLKQYAQNRLLELITAPARFRTRSDLLTDITTHAQTLMPSQHALIASELDGHGGTRGGGRC